MVSVYMLTECYWYLDDFNKIWHRNFQFHGLFVVPFDACSTVSIDVGCTRENSSGVAFIGFCYF